MTSDSDDALTWDGDEGTTRSARAPKRPDAQRDASPDPVRPAAETGEVGENPAVSDEITDAEQERPPLSAAMLLTLGVVGGVYLLYSVGWVVGGLRLKPLANLIVADAMYVPWFALAVAAPALWFLAVWVLTRTKASWIRIGLLMLGVVLLVPWPFVTVGVVGA